MILHMKTIEYICNYFILQKYSIPYFINMDKHISQSMNAGPYGHYQYLKRNYAYSLFFASVSSAEINHLMSV